MGNRKLPDTAHKIWEFNIYHDRESEKWYVEADKKIVYEVSENDAENSTEVMKLFVTEWDNDNIDF